MKSLHRNPEPLTSSCYPPPQESPNQTDLSPVPLDLGVQTPLQQPSRLLYRSTNPDTRGAQLRELPNSRGGGIPGSMPKDEGVKTAKGGPNHLAERGHHQEGEHIEKQVHEIARNLMSRI
ncbi:hypothetical protein STEG23_000008 [Scotinomys teguina]